MGNVVLPTTTSPTPFGGPRQTSAQTVPTVPARRRSGRLVDRHERERYVRTARQAARRWGIDEQVFVRQIQHESGFNPTARSPRGAVGIAQIVPRYHPSVNPEDPEASLDYAARLMRRYLDRYSGDYALALAAYNAGPGAVDRHGGVPPYPETQRYVERILQPTNRAAAPTPPSPEAPPAPPTPPPAPQRRAVLPDIWPILRAILRLP